MLDAASTFYTNLYTPDPVDQSSIDELLDSLPSSLRLSEFDQQSLQDPIIFDDLVSAVSRCPKRSSPGNDGLPYEVLRLILAHPGCQEIALAVYNDALCFGVFPVSWQSTCVSLLPKKGNLSDLRNWRPISLINTDAKVFTRILNARIIQCADVLISAYQTGFMHQRFIADNGLLMKLVMSHAQSIRSSAIGLFLDQEKAYDRVHPLYFQQVLLRFGFPPTIVQCLSNLFFDTTMQLNVNGFLSRPVAQQCGLRQGGPISPVLFNLTFEPFLRSILGDTRISGFPLPVSSALAVAQPGLSLPEMTTIKLLAYADDFVCLLDEPPDLHALSEHLERYSRASNARVNFHKTQAMSLSGRSFTVNPLVDWKGTLAHYRINNLHDHSSSSPVVYLGYPLYTTIPQRSQFLDSLTQKIVASINVHSQRSLSIRGRATIINSLILSKLWHVLRVTSVPSSFFQTIKSAVSRFLTFRMFPKISFSQLVLPRGKGCVGVLDPELQQCALQLRWLHPVLEYNVLSNTPTVSTSDSDDATSDTSDSELSIDDTLHSSIVLPAMYHYLIYSATLDSPASDLTNSNSFDPRLFFLFPDLRPPIFRRPNCPWYLLFQAVDRLPRSDAFATVVVSPKTCMSLPFSAVVLSCSDDTHFSNSFLRSPCSEAYIVDPVTGCTRPRVSGEFSTHSRLSKRFLRQVRSDQVKLQPFFVRSFILPEFAELGAHPFRQVLSPVVDAVPFLLALQLSTNGGSLKPLTSKQYRTDCQSIHSVSTASAFPLSKKKWSTFWRAPLTNRGRNVWFRLLHAKLPHRSLLHRILPQMFPFPSCPICSAEIESLDHFLFLCPLKNTVWQRMWSDYFPSSSCTNTILFRAILRLQQPHVVQKWTEISPMIIISSTLLAIWQHHWAFVFDSVPFQPESVIVTFQRLFHTHVGESLVAAGVSPFPIPFIEL